MRQSEERLTFTQLGDLLCSRQNIKKLAAVLEQKGFVTILQNTDDKRKAAWLVPAARLDEYFEQTAAIHRRKLSCLFRHYTDQEMGSCFTLLMKLYDGIDGLEAAEEAATEAT